MTDINEEKLTPSQAFKRLVAMRALLPEKAPPVLTCRRRRDNKLVHASLRVDDLVWFYHRGKIGGSRLRQLSWLDYDVAYGPDFFRSMKITWHPSPMWETSFHPSRQQAVLPLIPPRSPLTNL